MVSLRRVSIYWTYKQYAGVYQGAGKRSLLSGETSTGVEFSVASLVALL